MKKLFLSLFAICSFAMFSCGGSTDMAVAAAFYMEDLKAGDFEKFLDAAATPLDATTKASYLQQMEVAAETTGALTEYNVKSAVMTESGDQAQVIFDVTYASGTAIEYPMTLQLVDGDWKIVIQ